jgi:type II restriction enzyme
MPVNLDKPHLWKQDITTSVDMYNEWFVKFAPKTFREQRAITAQQVKEAMERTGNMSNVTVDILEEWPASLSMLRMSTCPPLARDRLIGLAGVSKTLVGAMEKKHRLPPRMSVTRRREDLQRIAALIMTMVDPDIFIWLGRKAAPSEQEVDRASTVVADRLCGAFADPIIRNAQEQRQLAKIGEWLEGRRYKLIETGGRGAFDKMPPGTFSFRMNVPVRLREGEEPAKDSEQQDDESLATLGIAPADGEVSGINIPVDVVIMPKAAKRGELPLLLEAKSAGDFTNVNKRRKEEAKKMSQLRQSYGNRIRFVLFLCGYFDSGYLGYEAADGIDWVWEHRIDDLAGFGL